MSKTTFSRRSVLSVLAGGLAAAALPVPARAGQVNMALTSSANGFVPAPSVAPETLFQLSADALPFTDAAGHALTVVGSPTVDTAVARVGAGSMTSPDTYSTHAVSCDDSDFAFGGNDFTIEFWHRPNATSINVLPIWVGDQSGSSRAFVAQLTKTTSTGYFNFYYTVNGAETSFNCTAPLTSGTWTHYAIERSGGTLRLYVDGVPQASDSIGTASLAHTTGWKLHVGAAEIAASGIMGHLDDVRISSIARYSGASFTPGA